MINYVFQQAYLHFGSFTSFFDRYHMISPPDRIVIQKEYDPVLTIRDDELIIHKIDTFTVKLKDPVVDRSEWTFDSISDHNFDVLLQAGANLYHDFQRFIEEQRIEVKYHTLSFNDSEITLSDDVLSFNNGDPYWFPYENKFDLYQIAQAIFGGVSPDLIYKLKKIDVERELVLNALDQIMINRDSLIDVIRAIMVQHHTIDQ